MVRAPRKTGERNTLLLVGMMEADEGFHMTIEIWNEFKEIFENAFKDARKAMILLDIEDVHTSPRILEGRHNDFKIKILPQRIPNYWGNPTVWEMLKATGFFHCRFICII